MQGKRNIELLRMSNSFKRAASEKEAELEVVIAKRKWLEKQKEKDFIGMFTRNADIEFILMYLMI